MPNRRSDGDGRIPSFPLAKFKIEPGQAYFFRVLSEEYDGLNTHYIRGKGSVLCHGSQCDSRFHKEDVIWKGYVSCDVWLEKPGQWYPTVLEITEHLELDMRGIYQRGQVWEIWKNLPTKKKASALTGRVHEMCDLDSLPPAFDYIPCLRALYHSTVLPMGKKNPLPDRVMVSARSGAPPAQSKAGIEAARGPVDTRPFAEILAERQRMANNEKPHSNGTRSQK